MLLVNDPGCDEIAKAARLQAWNQLQKLEADGFTPRQTAHYMSALSASARDIAITAQAEANELLRRRARRTQLQPARAQDDSHT